MNPVRLLAAFFVTGLFVSCLASGCSSDRNPPGQTSEEEEYGTPTGSVCPSGSTLTYENLAKPFAEKYCTRCHSSKLTGDARKDAPLGHDFDTESGILLVAEHVDEHAAAGPDAVNTLMPPTDPKPTEEERRQLGEWLACNKE